MDKEKYIKEIYKYIIYKYIDKEKNLEAKKVKEIRINLISCLFNVLY